jgi:BirA family biotin operon repressor/biotin-[acetyl-CoA-carboxylase] ligase
MFAKQIHHFYRIGSTNVAAMHAAAEGAPEGSVFLADEQTAGRGRGSHTWHSEKSAGIYCSVVLRPTLPPADVLVLSLAAGLAVHSAVTTVAMAIGIPLELDLKWPNDVLLGDRKFCGILTEMNAEPTRVRHVVVGVGMNVNHRQFPASLQRQAVSLCMLTGSEWSRVELTAALLKSLDREYRGLLQPHGRESIVSRFSEASSYVRGRCVRVEENGGFEGITEGLDERGFLRVRTDSGLRTVLSGSVRAAV